jgi:S-(hydroxymethyl)glutathione dehydrogenase/alcohol dehydrogenase
MSTKETVEEVIPGASRRDLLKNGVTVSLASGLAMMAAQDLAAQTQQAPAVLTGTMAGRKYRAFVRNGTSGAVEELRMMPLNEDRVVVRTQASQCSYTSCQNVLGNRPQQQAQIPGYGGVGIVEAIGSRVRRVQVGDRVIVADSPNCGQCYACVNGRPDRCLWSGAGGVAFDPVAQLSNGTPVAGAINAGGFGELMIAPEWFCVPVFDDSVSSLELAMLHETGSVGLGCVFSSAPVEPGSDVAVFGCGPIGLAAIQGARIKGAVQIIAIDPVAERRELAKKLGATVALNPHDYFDPGKPNYDFRSNLEKDRLVIKLRELCSGPTERRMAGGRPNDVNRNHAGPDFVIEAAGGDLYPPKTPGPDPTGLLPLYQAWAACTSTGHVCTTSIAHTTDFVLPANSWSNGSKNHHPGTHNGAYSMRDLPRAVKLIKSGKFNAKAVATATFPLDRIKEAYQQVADRTTITSTITFA